LNQRSRESRSLQQTLHCSFVNVELVSGKLFEYKLPPEWTWYREGHDEKIFREKKTKETFQAGLQYLPFYLQRALPNDDFINYLEKNKLDSIRAQELPRIAWAEDKTKVEDEVLAYLKVHILSLSN
jgi:hypothetical protein